MYNSHEDGSVLFGGSQVSPGAKTGIPPKGSYQYNPVNNDSDFIEFSHRKPGGGQIHPLAHQNMSPPLYQSSIPHQQPMV